MMPEVIECVANFSEGRRADVIAEIAASIHTQEQVILANVHQDSDHNRSVFTFLGAPQDVLCAAFRAIKTASERIDLNTHCGCHPRVGAADVIPFIPLRGVTIADCVCLARALGKWVADELNLPVFLYGEAATSDAHFNLANIRRGEYEQLKETIGTDYDHLPDFGPSEIGSAGASAIGVRDILIAYNIFLDSDNLSAAKTIARRIRTSSGGLAAVKALGLFVDGRGQVSMNLTDYRMTPPIKVIQEVRTIACEIGVELSHAELVGLMPSAALAGANVQDLLLYEFDDSRLLETYLERL